MASTAQSRDTGEGQPAQLPQLSSDKAPWRLPFLRVPGWSHRRITAKDWMVAVLLVACTALVRWVVLSTMAGVDATREKLTKWDAEIYRAIAEFGYFSPDGLSPADPGTYQIRLAFFPGLPAVMRAVHELTGADFFYSGLIVAVIASVFMATGIMALAGLMGAGLRGRTLAALLVLGAPMSITFMMPYSEPLFMALSFWALYFMVVQRWYLAALLVFFTGFVRLTAVDLWLTLGIVIALYAAKNIGAWLAWLVSVSPLVGYLVYASSFTQDIGGYFGMQTKGWNSTFDFGKATVTWVSQQLRTSDNVGYILSIGVIFAAVVSVFFAFRKLPWVLWIFATGVAANVLLSDGIMHSRPRLLLPALILLLPAVVPLARTARKSVIVPLTLAWVLLGAWFSAHMLAIFEWAI